MLEKQNYTNTRNKADLHKNEVEFDPQKAFSRSAEFFNKIKKRLEKIGDKIVPSKKTMFLAMASLITLTSESALAKITINNTPTPSGLSSTKNPNESAIKSEQPITIEILKTDSVNKMVEKFKKIGWLYEKNFGNVVFSNFIEQAKLYKENHGYDRLEFEFIVNQNSANREDKIIIKDIETLKNLPSSIILDGRVSHIRVQAYKNGVILKSMINTFPKDSIGYKDTIQSVKFQYPEEDYDWPLDTPFMQKLLTQSGQYKGVKFLTSKNVEEHIKNLDKLMPITYQAINEIQNYFGEVTLPVNTVEIVRYENEPYQATYCQDNTMAVRIGEGYLLNSMLRSEDLINTIKHEATHREDHILGITGWDYKKITDTDIDQSMASRINILEAPSLNTNTPEIVKRWFDINYSKTVFSRPLFEETLRNKGNIRSVYKINIYANIEKNIIYEKKSNNEVLNQYNEGKFYETGVGGHIEDNPDEFFASLISIITNPKFNLTINQKDSKVQYSYYNSLIDLQKTLINNDKIPLDAPIHQLVKEKINFINDLITE